MDFVSEPIKTPHYINNNMTNFEFDVGFIKRPGLFEYNSDKIQIGNKFYK